MNSERQPKIINQKKWTKEEEAFLIKNYGLLSCREIARSFNNGRNVRSIAKKARRLNLKKITGISTKIEKGQRFNKLVAHQEGKIVKIRKEVRRYWFFKCDCGKMKEISIRSVITGLTKSCGCMSCGPDRFLSQKPSGHVSWTHVFASRKMSAEYRGIDFNLNKDEYVAIATLPCKYCGSEPKKWNVYVKGDGTTRNRQYSNIKEDTIERAWIFLNGVDRQDNNIGYEVENCVPCCFSCNEMKMDKTVDDFLSHISKIFLFQWEKK